MSYLQYPGRVLGEKEAPYEPILKLVSAQLAIAPAAWELYAARDETRREHLTELLPRMGMEQFAATHYRSLATWLETTALQTTRGLVLARAVVEELRKRRIVLPPVAVVERLLRRSGHQGAKKSILSVDRRSGHGAQDET